MKLTLRGKGTAYLFLAVWVLLLITMTLIGFSDSAPEFIFLFYLVGMMAFLYLISGTILRDTNDKLVFWGSFVIKTGYALFRFPLHSITNPALTGDAAGFWNTAVQYYEGDFHRTYTSFPHFINMGFHVFGKNILCCCVTNIVFSMLMVLMVTEMMNRFDVTGNPRLLAIATSAFLVYGIQICNSLLREALYFAFITASFVYYVNYVQTRKASNILVAIVMITPVLILHIGYFPVAAVYILDFFVSEKATTKMAYLNRIIFSVLFVAFLFFAANLNSVDIYLTKGGSGFWGIINKIAGGSPDMIRAEAGSRYLPNIHISSLPTFFLYAPLKFFFYLFSPLPMNWRGITDVLAFVLDSCVHLLFVVLSVIAISRLKKAEQSPTREALLRLMRVGLWVVILCAFVFCLGTGTAGTAIRHRDALLGIEAILLGLGFRMVSSRA